MTIAGFNRLQLLGAIGADEIWSCGFNFATTAGEAAADTQADLAQWAANVKALNSGHIVGDTMLSFMGSGFTITGFKLAAVSGSTFKETAVAQVTLGSPVGGTGGPAQAQEVCCACSLLTGLPGRQNRGRVYWPAAGRGVGPTWRFGASDVEGLASDVASFISAVTGAAGASPTGAGEVGAGGTFGGVVVSRAGGHVTAITEVSVGDVPDVQRRRRNHEQELYRVASVAE